jgi:hypothetical protein
MTTIEQAIIEISSDPFNPQKNFTAAKLYEELEQTASAVSFYLRTAEYGSGVLVYNSLLKLGLCFNKQHDRMSTVSNCYMQAVSYMPERKEGYFLMSQFFERQQMWREAYTWACMGLALAEQEELPASVGYYGEYCLLFEKAVAAWWVGRADESKELFNILKDMDIAPSIKQQFLIT